MSALRTSLCFSNSLLHNSACRDEFIWAIYFLKKSLWQKHKNVLIWRGSQLECVPVPSCWSCFQRARVGVLWGRAPQKSISQSRTLVELCNASCIIARRAMCTVSLPLSLCVCVSVCSRSCGGVTWIDCNLLPTCIFSSSSSTTWYYSTQPAVVR